jgi:DNA-binding NtrC family response regulator
MHSRERRESSLRERFRTRSRGLGALLETAERLVDRDVAVLIVGESGVGKDYLASAIHASGSRRAAPFVHIDCGAIPHDLFESELFGYEKGTFTDAAARKIGKLEAAQNGTVYFDELSALTPPLQAKLLRAIEEKRFTRLGGHQPVAFGARVISSTNADVDQLIASGALRRDLLYRVNVVTLKIPPLRERREDIPLLARLFLRNSALGRIRAFDEEALRILTAHSWPGNVRELRNAVERAALIEKSDRITPASLDGLLGEQPAIAAAASGQWTLAQLEEHYIREILRQTRSNFTRAAAILGINRKTLLEKRRKYGLE